MNLESSQNQEEGTQPASQPDFPVRGWWRVLQGLFVIVLPSFSFWAAGLLKPDWQSGDRQAYLALLLSVEASSIFLVLLAYSILSYLLLLIDPDRFARSFLIRFGIYSGAALALQYSILLFLYLFDNKLVYAIFLLWLFPLYYPRFHRWAVRRWNVRLVGWLIGILLVTALAIGFSIAREFLFFIVVGLVIAGPFWSLLIALQAGRWLYQTSETRHIVLRGLGVTAWAASYIIAWRYDILKMYELYAELPLVPPDCYIATAAAKGHPKFVGSKMVQLANGNSMHLNRQLQIFKCAELALLALAPRFHNVLREIYDSMGRPLARAIHHPLLADAAYLLLKPFEWLAGFTLRRLLPEIDSISIYNSSIS